MKPRRASNRQAWWKRMRIFLLERFLRHHGNADVVHQALAAELGVEVSLRTVQRAVKPHRERLKASQLATQRFETKPGKQLQIDFGEKWSLIEGRQQKLHLLVATLGYSRRLFAKAYSQETQREWFDGTEGAFAHRIRFELRAVDRQSLQVHHLRLDQHLQKLARGVLERVQIPLAEVHQGVVVWFGRP